MSKYYYCLVSVFSIFIAKIVKLKKHWIKAILNWIELNWATEQVVSLHLWYFHSLCNWCKFFCLFKGSQLSQPTVVVATPWSEPDLFQVMSMSLEKMESIHQSPMEKRWVISIRLAYCIYFFCFSNSNIF